MVVSQALLGIGDAEPEETTFVIALFRASSKHVCVCVFADMCVCA